MMQVQIIDEAEQDLLEGVPKKVGTATYLGKRR